MVLLDLSKKVNQWVALFLLAFIWGSSFILMKRGLESYSDKELAAVRMVIAAFCLLPFALRSMRQVSLSAWKYVIAVGLFGNAIPAFLFSKAQTEISSSLAGMLNSLVPLFALIIGYLFFKVSVGTSKLIGVVIGLAGATALILSNGVDMENTNLSYSFYIIAATICYAISVNIIKKYLKNVDALAITSLSFLCIGPPLLLYLFTTNFLSVTIIDPNAIYSLTYISILAIFGTVLSLIIFNALVKETSPVFATMVTYLIPIVAIFWGVIDGETVHFLQIASVSVILLGIYFVNRGK